MIPLDNFGTVVGENQTPGILTLWAVNSLSIVYWGVKTLQDSVKCSPIGDSRSLQSGS